MFLSDFCWVQGGTIELLERMMKNHKSLIVLYNLLRCSLYLGQNRRKCSILSLSLPHSHIGDVLKPHRKQSSFNIVSPSSNRQYITPVFLSACRKQHLGCDIW